MSTEIARYYAEASIARALKVAREHAGFSQDELAAKLGKSQSMVAGAEAGRVRVGEHYVAAVLKACGLPKDWRPNVSVPSVARAKVIPQGAPKTIEVPNVRVRYQLVLPANAELVILPAEGTDLCIERPTAWWRVGVWTRKKRRT